MKTFIFAALATLLSTSALAQVPSEPFGPDASCEAEAKKTALKRHVQKFPDAADGLKVTYERFLGRHKFGLTEYEVYMFGGTDEVDGGGWLLTYTTKNNKCRLVRSVFLNY
jgi:hypothetical protein